MFRRIFLGFLWLALVSFAFGQRGTSDIELRIKITYDNDRLVGTALRVQLLNDNGNMIADTFSDGTGQAVFSSLHGGNYKVRVSGIGVAETVSDTFTVDQRDRFATEYVHVKPAETPQANGRAGNPISAVELNIPDKARKEFDKGTEAMAKSRWEDAQKHFTKATEIYPRYASAFNNLGIVAINENKLPAAQAYFQQAIKLDDHLASAYLNVSKLEYNEHHLQEAESSLVKALALDPMNVEAMVLMAASQLATGGLDQAIAYAHRVHTLPHEKFAISHIIAARAFEQGNRAADAIGEYQLYVQEAPQSSLAPGARSAIARLQQQH
ncbi:MAG TPA: tetratricopeptide repeat protein [Terriglobales bacterium]